MKREKINHDSMKSAYNGLLKTFVAKNKDYGNSFERSLDQHGLIAGIVRMEDKMNRLSTLVNGDKDAQVASESLSDTLLDLSNYAAMSACWLMAKDEETRDECYVKNFNKLSTVMRNSTDENTNGNTNNHKRKDEPFVLMFRDFLFFDVKSYECRYGDLYIRNVVDGVILKRYFRMNANDQLTVFKNRSEFDEFVDKVKEEGYMFGPEAIKKVPYDSNTRSSHQEYIKDEETRDEEPTESGQFTGLKILGDDIVEGFSGSITMGSEEFEGLKNTLHLASFEGHQEKVNERAYYDRDDVSDEEIIKNWGLVGDLVNDTHTIRSRTTGQYFTEDDNPELFKKICGVLKDHSELTNNQITEDDKNDEVFKEVMKINSDMISFYKGRSDAQHVDGGSFSVVPNDKRSVSVTGSGQQFFYNSDYIGKFVFDPHMLLTNVDDNGNEFKTPFIMSFNREGREGYLSLTYPYLKDYSDFNKVCENFVRFIDQNAINHDDKEFDIEVAGIDIPMDDILYDQLVTKGSSLMRQFANDECFNARYGNFLYGSQVLWHRDKKVFFVKCFVKNFSYPAVSQMDAIYFADTRELLTSISGEYIDILVGDDGSFEWFVAKDGKYLGVDFKNYPRTPNYDKYLVKVDNFVWVDSEKLEDI